MKSLSVTFQVKASEKDFPVVLFIIVYMVVLSIVSVDGVVYYAVQGSSNFPVCS